MKKIALSAALALCASSTIAEETVREGGYWSIGYSKVTTELKTGDHSLDLQSLNVAWGYHFH